MKIILLSLILLSLNTFADEANCNLKIDNKYCVELEWMEGPYTDAYSNNSITIKDLATGNLIDLPGLVDFKVWMVMDMHAHGGAPVLLEKQGLGKYFIDEIYFFTGMNGKWQFKMTHNENEYILFEMDI